MPCTSVVTPGTPTCTCTDPGPVTVTLVGSVGVTYNVTMRIRGVVETKDYIGGRQLVTPAESSDTYVVEDSTYLGAPVDNLNVYGLSISNPTHIYYLNSSTSHPWDASPYAVDYTFTVQMTTGATVQLFAYSIEDVQVSNDGELEVDNSPAIDVTQPYNGQFLEMIVTSVTPV